MKTEKGVAMVVYKVSRRNPRYAVLKRTKNWEGWETPKGHLENDDYRETVEIELGEETGIAPEEIESVEELDHTVKWKYEDGGEEVQKKYRAFLVKVSDDAVIDVDENPHDEHEKGFFLNFDDARSLLTYEDNRELLEIGREAIEGA